ncbi:MAG: hypothetical protein H6900_09910 [Rhodobacter sp.]|nr:hypothetical protein [Paracoccaceae bacterium]MCC0073589.1 hypothetical protein [Rhodobacter sp.]
MKVEFKSRRFGATERQRQLVEEARAAREAKSPDVDRMLEALEAGRTVAIRLPPIPPRHPATGIGE